MKKKSVFKLTSAQRARLNALLEQEGIDAPTTNIPQRPDTQQVPLSFAQERLWYVYKLMPEQAAYNIPVSIHLRGMVDVARLQASFNAVIARHDSLRSVFVIDQDTPTQRIVSQLTVTIECEDLRSLAPQEQAHQLTAIEQAVVQRPLPIDHAPLYRVHLLQLDDDEFILLFVIHHIIADGWSLAVLFGEIAKIYNVQHNGKAPDLPPLPIQYADFADWQRKRLTDAQFDAQRTYWREQLAGELPLTTLPTNVVRPEIQQFVGKYISHTLADAVADGARALARQADTTLLVVLLAAYKALLHRYTGQTDLIIGSPVTTRTRRELEGQIGHFINTQALRTTVESDLTFRELLARERSVVLDAFSHQDMPFESLLDLLKVQRSLKQHPIYQTTFILQDVPAHANWRTALQLDGVVATQRAIHTNTAKFDLTLEVEVLPRGLTVSAEFDTTIYDRKQLERFLAHYEQLLTGVVADWNRPIGNYNLLTEAESLQIQQWNQTETDYPRDACLHTVFERQAAQTPDAIALKFDGQTMTYGELNRRANQLAHYLRQMGVRPTDFVSISVERSFEMIIGIFGILKTGAAFVPLDVAYPTERLAFMLADTKTEILLTQQKLVTQLPPHQARVICLESEWDTIAAQPTDNLELDVHPLATGCVLYTSGSTGRPKGVCLTHRAGVRLAVNTNYADYRPTDTVLQFAPASFDASTIEMWGALLNGARLHIAPPRHLSYSELGRLIVDEGITVMWLTAGLFHPMVEQEIDSLRGVRIMMAGGDTLSPTHTRKLVREQTDGVMLNGYGPTENGAFTTYFHMRDPADIGRTVPVGYPLANTTVYILDDDYNLTPIGVVGRLYTGGDGLASHYLNRPQLTAARFLPDPFSPEPGARMYDTGDLARYLPDGSIEFLGRLDFQVKIRGFRVELGAIETSLENHPAIASAVVIALQQGDAEKQLVAYYVLDRSQPVTTPELRHYLKERLPNYMIPAHLIEMETLPLNPNGKVDRHALPKPSTTRQTHAATLVAPRNAIEEQVSTLWCEVLEVNSVSVHDNFFDLGGDSLLLMQLHSGMEKQFGMQLPVVSLFTHTTVTAMAQLVTSDSAETTPQQSLTSRAALRRQRMQRRRKR